jgi:hypothetical protein
MRSHGYRRASLPLAALLLVLGSVCAWAQSPQTIVIDGVNDFDLANRLDQDANDTEVPNIDIGDFYVTNDAVKLYVGFEHDQAGWSQVQLGIAIDVGTAAGGETDPWGRAIEWSLAPNKPDFMFYVNLDNNWQAGYQWGGTDWVGLGTAGPGALGWNTTTGFRELAILLSTLGVSASDVINIEAWVTQDSPLKGPLDCVANDDAQLSLPDFTLWETETPIPLDDYLPYTVQSAVDLDPPVVEETRSDPDFPAESFFDVLFNEPVDQTTAEAEGNYQVSGGDGGIHNVVAATRDGSFPNVVHLEVSGAMTASGELYDVTVTGVQDLAGNPIVADGSGNVACFMLKSLIFRGLFGPYLQNHSSPPDQFSVEGDVAPLTFDPLCDTGLMVDTGVDDIWQYTNLFHVSGDCQAGTAEKTLNWKFAHNCTTYEPLASNRQHTMSLANGPQDLLEFYWNNEDPSQFTSHDIDVEFFVDMNLVGTVPTDVVAINGSAAPLTYDVPSLNVLVDDGTGNDAVSGDGIYSTVLRFPTGSPKDVYFKYLLNDEYECFGQGDRNVYLNDEMYDTVGGTLGPLTLPVAMYDYCTVSWQAVEVIFTVDVGNSAWHSLRPTDVISINGTPSNSEPLVFSWDIPSLNALHDDGAYPDAVAGDKIFSISIIFPEGSTIDTEYKYLYNDAYECPTQGNRGFGLDPRNHDAAGNPQILPLDDFQLCQVVDVPLEPGSRLSVTGNVPNPFNPSTEIRFAVPRAGHGSLRIYDARGQLVRVLHEGRFAAGPGSMHWDGRTDSGRQAGSGVYFCLLEVDGASATGRMVLLK